MIMGSFMRSATIAFCVAYLTIATFHNCFCKGKSNTICNETEKQALLKFKQDLKDPSNQLSSWAGEDCCQWAGVVCNYLTGHVHKIRLRNLHPFRVDQTEAEYEAYLSHKLGGTINPSLLDLKYLRHPDLSCNDFEGIPIPSFIGSIGRLRYLNLSQAGFSGTIPHQLGNLTMMRYLGLGGTTTNFNVLQLHGDNLQWLSGLLSLQHLDMLRVDLSKALDWLQVINALPSLTELHMSSCELKYVSPSFNINFTSLAILDLSYNKFESSVFGWIFSLSHLVSLDISGCNFYGPLPNGLLNMTSLRVLDLSWNFFNSTMPNWLYDLSQLESLNLAANHLEGEISSDIGNLTSLVTLDLSFNQLEKRIPSSLGKLCKLKKITLSSNKFGGEIAQVFKIFSQCMLDGLEWAALDSNDLLGHLSDELGHFKNLSHLHLSNNSISGLIPASIGKLSSLISLDLSQNRLNGTLPETLGQLVKLEWLGISNNLLKGVVSDIHFANLTRLCFFYAFGNNLILKASDSWVPPFQIKRLSLTSWQLGPKFPLWLESQEKLIGLDMANTNISDSIPTWFWNMPSRLQYLNLSCNQIHREIPRIIEVLFFGTIDMSSNYLEGQLPFISSNLMALDLSNNYFSGSIHHVFCGTEEKPINLLFALVLGDNYLSGGIPDCWGHWPFLQTIRLENNNLMGNIPPSIGNLNFLAVMHLRHNNLSGELPQSLQHCTNLLTLDLGENEFTGSIPIWIGNSFSNLIVLNLRANKFQGEIPYELCRLGALQILDLARNNLSGLVPRCFNNFSAMARKQHSSNHLSYHTYRGEYFESATLVTKGREVLYNTNLIELCRLGALQILDLARNNLSGLVPRCFNNFSAMARKQNSSNHLSYHTYRGEYFESATLVTKGREVLYNTNLKLVTSMDLSENNLFGEIPKVLTRLVGLWSLNLSSNHLTGRIPENIGDMGQLESLDCSLNQLSGEIPFSMSSLSFLSYLNLSYNNLTGKIPSSTQLQSLDESSFIGIKLCGPPLTNCSTNTTIAKVGHGGEEDEGLSEVWFFLSLALGFVVGFWIVVGLLLFKMSWRDAYFMFLDRIGHKLSNFIFKCCYLLCK
ncbi:Receptor-like protein EIX2 [Camellia lanceoleosa]|uniref:Receptor-like protein EIX2 n=1 Tax=Camellia lanceoleosa TaxID=1840588 RepID=A0ACC0J4N2_9ERIC|nr:Receptor-like protein EIX2 [Camellia lanceoleosa]